MFARFPTVAAVREAHPAEVARVLAELPVSVVEGAPAEHAEVLVAATQKVASWCAGVQAMAVDRFAECVADQMDAHSAELVAARDAQRIHVESAGGRWRGGTGPLALPEPDAVAASMIAPVLRISPRAMRTRLGRARRLVNLLPGTLALALDGRLEPWRVDSVVLAARDVAIERVAEFEARLLATDVEDLPKPRLMERASRAAAKADPEGAAAARRGAASRRALTVTPAETPGLVRWTAELPDELSRRMFAAVDELADEYLQADAHVHSRTGAWPTGARRSVAAARVDALGDLVMSSADVTTVVELVVPIDAGAATTVTRTDPVDAATALIASSTQRRRCSEVGSPATDVHPAQDAGAAAADQSGARPDSTPADFSRGMDADNSAGSAADVDTGRTADHNPGSAPDDDAGPVVEHEWPRPADHQGASRAALAPSGPTSWSPGEGCARPVVIDLVLGQVTSATLAAGHLERELGMRLGQRLEIEANPFLTERGGQVWFVDGLVQSPGAATLLPEHVVALLRDPDTRLRVTNQAPHDHPASGVRGHRSDPGRVATGSAKGSSDGDHACSDAPSESRRRRTYRPGAALAAAVRTRDRHCRFPGCSVPAPRCQLDHVVPYPEGDTALDNLHSLCPAHHGFKHHAGWTLTMTPDGTCTWTAPTGRTHVTTPAGRRDLAA